MIIGVVLASFGFIVSVWISVVPSVSLGLHFDPQEFNTELKWWLGVNPSVGLDGNLMACPLCPGNSLDSLGYHCVTCKRGSDVTLRHNAIRDVLFSTFHRAGLSSHLEVGSGWGQDSRGPVKQTSLSSIGTTASQQPSMSLLHLRSILVLLWKRACTLALQQEQLSSGNILKMTQNVLH